MRASFPLIGHTALWALAAAAFVWIAARHVLLPGQLGPVQPFHSTNRYFASTIHSLAGSERLLEVFQSLPENEPVAVMYRDDEEVDTFIAFAVMYFAWPRKVHSFPIKHGNLTSQVQALAAAPVSAAFFCGMEAPAGTEPLFRLGQGLALSPRTTTQPR